MDQKIYEQVGAEKSTALIDRPKPGKGGARTASKPPKGLSKPLYDNSEPNAEPFSNAREVAGNPQKKTAFDSFVEEQFNLSGGAMIDGGDDRSGAVFQEGPLQGMTVGQAKEHLREKYAGMNDTSEYDQRAKAWNARNGLSTDGSDRLKKSAATLERTQGGEGRVSESLIGYSDEAAEQNSRMDPNRSPGRRYDDYRAMKRENEQSGNTSNRSKFPGKPSSPRRSNSASAAKVEKPNPLANLPKPKIGRGA